MKQYLILFLIVGVILFGTIQYSFAGIDDPDLDDLDGEVRTKEVRTLSIHDVNATVSYKFYFNHPTKTSDVLEKEMYVSLQESLEPLIEETFEEYFEKKNDSLEHYFTFEGNTIKQSDDNDFAFMYLGSFIISGDQIGESFIGQLNKLRGDFSVKLKDVLESYTCDNEFGLIIKLVTDKNNINQDTDKITAVCIG